MIGSTSAAALPGLLAPWAVLPLVTALRERRSLVVAGARSGVAVLLMGGVNAVSTMCALVLPALYILTHARGRRRVKAGLCGRLPWPRPPPGGPVPLLLQGRYSFNFLPYVEQAATTTKTMSAAAFLRGTGNWTAYLDLGTPWLSAGWAMVATPAAIAAAAVAAAAGLSGLARRDMPEQLWLRLAVGLAALVALAGYPGPLGGPLHGVAGTCSTGRWPPLRSVYKLEPVVAVALALGIAHVLVLRTKVAWWPAGQAPRALWHVFAVPMIGLVLIGLAYPQVSGQVLNAGSFSAIPGYWYQAAAYLRQHSPRAPALVLPGAAHGIFTWGEPVDEPLEPLASSPWAAQGLVPYGGAGSELLLRSIDGAINSGERIPGLVAALRRSGIGYVLVRNDLSSGSIGYTPPQQMHQALASSGFHVVASFGPRIGGGNPGPSRQRSRPRPARSRPRSPAIRRSRSSRLAARACARRTRPSHCRPAGPCWSTADLMRCFSSPASAYSSRPPPRSSRVTRSRSAQPSGLSPTRFAAPTTPSGPSTRQRPIPIRARNGTRRRIRSATRAGRRAR